jgi:hypothetical protein
MEGTSHLLSRSGNLGLMDMGLMLASKGSVSGPEAAHPKFRTGAGIF